MSVAGVVHAAKVFLRTERRWYGRTPMPLRRRLWLYSHGMFSKRDRVWDLSAATIGEYLSDRQWSATGRIDRPYGAGLKNKALFRSLIDSTHSNLLPELYGVVRDGEVLAEAPGELASTEGLLALCRDERVVSKPVDGAKGDEVRVIDAVDGSYYVDGREVHSRDLLSTLGSGRDLLLEAYVSQAEYASTIYPDAANTVRFLTMLDRRGEPFVAAAMHRFGTAGSGTVDNWAADGLSVGIDRETGVLGRAARTDSDGLGVGWTDEHPDTGAPIAGTPVAGWDRVVETVLDIAGEYAWLWPYVGWDVVVTDEAGSVAIVEGNRQPGIEALQIHQPLLRDARVRRFFERHGVVS